MVTGWVLLMWSICSIIDVAIAADHTGFDITILQSAGGLFGFFLGSPLAWGLSNVFAIIIFVVVGLFSLLMITGTHVTDLPEDARKIAAKSTQTVCADGPGDGWERQPVSQRGPCGRYHSRLCRRCSLA